LPRNDRADTATGAGDEGDRGLRFYRFSCWHARYYRYMFSSDQYHLIDFGEGRKLERFGQFILDRPSPAARSIRPSGDARWATADARFESAGDVSAGCGQRGQWTPPQSLPSSWTIENSPLVFELRPTEFGHVGVFPEQAANWDWIVEQVERLKKPSPDAPPRVLNLFAYTGGSTLAAAAAGAEVVHVDSAKSTVSWARRNAELSGLAEAPIRWIVEDARRFVAREQKRGNRYHGIILDPPSYGHGPKGEPWQLARDLPALLAACTALLDVGGFMLVTCHSPDIEAADLAHQLRAVLPPEFASCDASDLWLTSRDARRLHSGVSARVSGGNRALSGSEVDSS
jgi:23S rRNA (cytosine1962-C5)-methyltransferase